MENEIEIPDIEIESINIYLQNIIENKIDEIIAEGKEQ